MSEFTVTLDACVAGNPFKAWNVRLPEGETRDDPVAPDREPPDDVWESQSHDFDSLDAAKDFIRSLPEQTTTHVQLHAGDELIYVQDADADHLDAAAPGVEMPHTVDSPLPFTDVDVPDAPPLMPAQGATQ